MSEQVTLKAAVREETGKGSCRTLRIEKMVPGVFYAKNENILIKAPLMSLEKVYAAVRTSQLLSLEIEGKGTFTALIKELVRHPFKNEITHFDIMGVDMEKTVRVSVPMVTVGRAPSMAMGSRLEVYRSIATIECLPGNIPASIEIDITNFKDNDTLQIEDVVVPEGVKKIYDDNFAVLRLVAKGAAVAEDEEEEA